MKKNLLFVLSMASVLSCAAGLSSCGEENSLANPDFNPVSFDTSKEVEITFYSTMGDNLQKVFNEFVEEFNEEYPNIKVTHTQPGSYDGVRDQIKTELSNGQHPNLAYCYPDHVALYNKARAVITLDNLIADKSVGLSKDQKADFVEGYYEAGKNFGDGKMYTLPFSKSTEVLYYNKTFFEKNSLQVPTTWDEMENVCKAIKEIDPKSIPLGYDSEANWFISMCEQQGSTYTAANSDTVEGHFLFNNDQNKAFVKKFANWYANGYVTTQSLYGNYTSGLFTEISATAQKSYMSIGSSAGASHQVKVDGAGLAFEVGIAPIPQVNTAAPKAISQGPDVCIFNDSDPQKVMASWLLLKYLTTNADFQAEFGMASGYVPILKSVQDSDVYKSFLADAGTTTSDAVVALSAKVCNDMAQNDYFYTSPAFIGSSEARDQVGSLLVSAMTAAAKAKGDDAALNSSIDELFANAITLCVENSK